MLELAWPVHIHFSGLNAGSQLKSWTHQPARNRKKYATFLKCQDASSQWLDSPSWIQITTTAPHSTLKPCSRAFQTLRRGNHLRRLDLDSLVIIPSSTFIRMVAAAPTRGRRLGIHHPLPQ